jgi:hypothetical protein
VDDRVGDGSAMGSALGSVTRRRASRRAQPVPCTRRIYDSAMAATREPRLSPN